MRITFVGHATMLVETEKCKFITDPLLVKRIARIGPKRKLPRVRILRPRESFDIKRL